MSILLNMPRIRAVRSRSAVIKFFFGLFAPLSAFVTPAQAEDKEPALVFEMGGSGGWPLSQGSAAYGPEVALKRDT
jgi:hypothetical protein